MLKVLFPWKQNNTKKVLFAMEQVLNGAESASEEQPPEELALLPCHVCNRTFLPKPLKKHIPICEQTLRRKRKPFDSLKQRVEGTDMAPFYQKTYLKKSNPEISSQAQAGDVYGSNKVSKWREKHFELQKTIKNAKEIRPDMTTNPPTNNTVTPNRKAAHLAVSQSPSNERCPVCDRSFGPKAFDRHVEFCREQKNRVQVHKSPAVVQQAKERLEARINYRVPPLRQSKRSLIRDKYSPSSQTHLLLRSNSIGPTGKSTTSLSVPVTTMGPNRRQPVGNVEKSIERNHKKEAVSKTRVDRTIGDCGDTNKEPTKNENGSKSFQTKRTIPSKKINKTEINDSLQGITVSSLSVEKNKKLVTWKDTVKAQPKVTPSISLTTSSSNTKRRVVPNTNERESDALKASVRVPSLGKVTRSRMLLEKLNLFVCTKSTEKIQVDHKDSAEDFEKMHSENTFSMKKEKSAADCEYNNDDAVLEDMGIEEALDLSVLTQISEEGEIEDVSPKFSTNISAKVVHKKTVSFAADCPLNVTQDIERSVEREENDKLKLTNRESSSNKYDISSSEDASHQESGAESANNKDQRDYSDDETKTENTSSLCLRLPLEGMESEVMLRNKDLDPDQKLKKNIKSFYELMKARRCKVTTTIKQPSVLESSRDLQLLVASPKDETVSPIFSGTNLVENLEVNDVSETVVGELAPKMSRENLETATAFDSSKKVTFKIASRQPRTWKRRKKLQKCRMCVRCFMRKVRSRRDVGWWYLTSSTEEIEGFDELGSSYNELVSDSSQILLQDPLEQIPKSSVVREVFSRKSRSSGCLTDGITRKKCNSKKSSMEKTFCSLPNIHMDCTTSNSYKLSANNSFDNVIPRKRRKISASYFDRVSGDEGCMVQANLRQNISKIREKKKEVGLPLILDYESVGLSEAKITPADILYVNAVFEASLSPERSELDSVNIGEYDGIKEYGDEELDGWEAAEEELLKVPEQNELSTTFELPTRLSRPKTDTLVDPETDIKMDCLKIDGVESTKTLQNISRCTIVNEASAETDPVKIGSVAYMIERPTVPEDTETSPGKLSPVGFKTIGDKIPCRLPRIILQNKQATPLRPLMGPAHGALKLPDIRAHKDFEVNKLTIDKLVQVPSNRAIASASFSQQTSAIFINACTSFNSGEFKQSVHEQSPELQRNKNNRRLVTSSLSKHAGLELKKALAEKKEDISPKEEIFNINRTPTAEELYPDNPQMYEEFRKYEEMYRREKEGRSSSSKKQKKTADFGINIEESTKTYGDSAYGSLNRKQPMAEHENTDQLKEFGANKRSNATTPIERLPKFCHECGNRYPVATAKFCVECGVRRLVL